MVLDQVAGFVLATLLVLDFALVLELMLDLVMLEVQEVLDTEIRELVLLVNPDVALEVAGKSLTAGRLSIRSHRIDRWFSHKRQPQCRTCPPGCSSCPICRRTPSYRDQFRTCVRAPYFVTWTVAFVTNPVGAVLGAFAACPGLRVAALSVSAPARSAAVQRATKPVHALRGSINPVMQYSVRGWMLLQSRLSDGLVKKKSSRGNSNVSAISVQV